LKSIDKKINMEVTRLFDILEHLRENYLKEDILARKENGVWIKYSTHEYIELVDNFSLGLLTLGFSKGDKIASISNNRPEWNIADMGMNQIGVIHVPIYPTISAEEHIFILNHSETKAVMLGNKSQIPKLIPLFGKAQNINYIFTFDEIQGLQSWTEIVELGKKEKNNFQNKLDECKKSISPSDIATIIYTSGTTGQSKGVMLSHNNIIQNFMPVVNLLLLNHTHRVLSFLPLCHVYERTVNYLHQYKGISIYYAESMTTIIDNLKELKINGFNTVPRLLERLHEAFLTKGKDLSGIKKIIYFWAMRLANKFEIERKRSWWYNFKLKIADKLIYTKWREALGGSICFIGCGGAALQPRLARLFMAAGFPIQEGYGLTETSPLITINHNKAPNIRFGSVGVKLENVEIKIADDGEILCKGPSVMIGYYKDEALTKSVFDDEGWFHTGDIGMIEDGRFLKITDRKKEMFKTSGGKYIAPQAIENKLKESFLISQAMVIGSNEKFASALISPNFDLLHSWCARKKIHFRDNRDLIQIPRVQERMQQEIDEVNKTLAEHEKIKRIRLVTEEWTQNTGELSPTLKLKRKVLNQKYKEIIDEIYGRNREEQPTKKNGLSLFYSKQIIRTLNKVKNIILPPNKSDN
jgi:long-chain acyl-CoA synthetase